MSKRKKIVFLAACRQGWVGVVGESTKVHGAAAVVHRPFHVHEYSADYLGGFKVSDMESGAAFGESYSSTPEDAIRKAKSEATQCGGAKSIEDARARLAGELADLGPKYALIPAKELS